MSDSPAYPTRPCATVEPYALQVLDDAMAPEFPAGCIIIIEPASTAPIGAFVLAEDGADLVLRQLTEVGGAQWLLAMSPDYPAISIPRSVPQGSDRVSHTRICGVVVQRGRSRGIRARHYPLVKTV